MGQFLGNFAILGGIWGKFGPNRTQSLLKITKLEPNFRSLSKLCTIVHYIRNKAKTREEKKMEVIMKSIEAMERTEARRRAGGDYSRGKFKEKRRRPNSIKRMIWLT